VITAPAVHTSFELPPGRVATAPPEARGLERDEVRLLVAHECAPVLHTTFRSFAEHLDPGDLLVVNTSATVAAAVDGRRVPDAAPVVVHFSTPLDVGDWIVELRRVDQSGPVLTAEPGDVYRLPKGGRLTLLDTLSPTGRLWRARIEVRGDVPTYLDRHGRAIAYEYIEGRWPITAYQTIFARDPGSAEMPSAGRPFSARVLRSLRARRVELATILLHTGVSSLEAHEPPQAERYRVGAATADAVNRTRARGGRIVAVGTTVARALETVADADGHVVANEGWTELVLGPDRPARVVDGLVTGWHPPEASHLALLEAVAGGALVQRAYDAAVRGDYRWHEFGDSCLLLPARLGDPCYVTAA
jgi:S-adenosylmethionine:tRNA ribosyltransferase-isomerase